MLNPEEEAKFDALRKNCRDLGVPFPPEIHIGFEVVDKNGDLIFEDRQRGHSWTRNFYNFMYSTLTDGPGTGTTFEAGEMNIANTGGGATGGSGHTAARSSMTLLGYGHTNNSTSNSYGIVVGTSDSSFDVEHFQLQALVSSGAGSGQLVHSKMAAPEQSYGSASKIWTNTASRVFNNNSGGSIIIAETGLLQRAVTFGNSGWSWLKERSVLDPTVTVPNGAQLTVSYDISMDFSAIDS